MSEHARNAVIVCFIMTIVMAILPPAAFGGQRGVVWDFVKEYQTLLTGVLAVGGAFATIREMQRTDKGAQWRHRQLVRLSTRADALRVERLVNPNLDTLQEAFHFLSEQERYLRDIGVAIPGQGTNIPWGTVSLARVRHMHRQCQKISEVLATTAWSEACDLFNGSLSVTATSLRRVSDILLYRLQEASEKHFLLAGAEAASKISKTDAEHEFQFHLDQIFDALNQCLAPLGQVVGELQDMRDLYLNPDNF
ncbi:hypothetical protein [Neorhizobium petrolearium]|uniref:hypothetical protein n=1 Tax=Neorhizobium petrolearium TaxID=515361 RepID=UPI003F7F7EC9